MLCKFQGESSPGLNCLEQCNSAGIGGFSSAPEMVERQISFFFCFFPPPSFLIRRKKPNLSILKCRVWEDRLDAGAEVAVVCGQLSEGVAFPLQSITRFNRGFQPVNVQEQVTAARLCPCQIREPRILISHQVIKAHFKCSHFKWMEINGKG